VQEEVWREKEQSKSVGLIYIDEDQLEVLVGLVTSNEENGELVNKTY
jgi:hypothetical protein